MIVAGLTGGIATGKSTVSAFLAEAGAVIIDADRIAKEAVLKGTPAWQSIVDRFGRGILGPTGDIDRDALGDKIFKDPAQKSALNRIVHPFVFEETTRRLKKIEANTPKAVVILDVPLLIETHMHKGMSDVILVYVPETLQLERLRSRNGYNREDALARIRSQMPIEAKKAFAHYVIDNSGSLEATREQTMDVFRKLADKAKNNL